MLVAANGWWFGSIIFFLIWIAIAFWPARVAGRKGHSFIGFFLFSLIFFPAALIGVPGRRSKAAGDSLSRTRIDRGGTRCSGGEGR